MSDNLNDPWSDYQSIRDWVNQRKDPWDTQTQWGFVSKDGVGTSAQGTFECQLDGFVHPQTVPGQCFTGDWVPIAWGYDDKQAPIPLRQTIIPGFSIVGGIIDTWHYVGGPPDRSYSGTIRTQSGAQPLTLTPATTTILGGPGSQQTVSATVAPIIAPSMTLTSLRDVRTLRVGKLGYVYAGFSDVNNCGQIHLLNTTGGVDPITGQADGTGNTVVTEFSNVYTGSGGGPNINPWLGMSSDVHSITFLSCDDVTNGDSYAMAVVDNAWLAVTSLSTGQVWPSALDSGEKALGEPIMLAGATATSVVFAVLTGAAFGGNYQEQDGAGTILVTFPAYPSMNIYLFTLAPVAGVLTLTRSSKTALAGDFGTNSLFWSTVFNNTLVGVLAPQPHTEGPGFPQGLIYHAASNCFMVATATGHNVLQSWSADLLTENWQINGGNDANTTTDMTGIWFEKYYGAMAVEAGFAVLYGRFYGTTAVYQSPILNHGAWDSAYDALLTSAELPATSYGSAVSDLTAALATITAGSFTETVWIPSATPPVWGIRVYDPVSGAVISDQPYTPNVSSIEAPELVGNPSTPSTLGGAYWTSWRVATTTSYTYAYDATTNTTTFTADFSLGPGEVILVDTFGTIQTKGWIVFSASGGAASTVSNYANSFAATGNLSAPADPVTWGALIPTIGTTTFEWDPGPIPAYTPNPATLTDNANPLMFTADPGGNALAQLVTGSPDYELLAWSLTSTPLLTPVSSTPLAVPSAPYGVAQTSYDLFAPYTTSVPATHPDVTLTGYVLDVAELAGDDSPQIEGPVTQNSGSPAPWPSVGLISANGTLCGADQAGNIWKIA